VKGLESGGLQIYNRREQASRTRTNLGQPTPPREQTANNKDGAPGTSVAELGRNVVMRGNRFDSRDIFQSVREIIIAHGEETYRLRLTAQNKLILTK
jgi:hemin uptake protein HemP